MDNIEMDALKESLEEQYKKAYDLLNDDIKENSNKHNAEILHEMIDMKNKYKKIMNKTSENMWKAAVNIVSKGMEIYNLRTDVRERDKVIKSLIKYTNTLCEYIDSRQEILDRYVNTIKAQDGIVHSRKEKQDNPNFKGMSDEMLRQLWEVCEGNINKIKKELKNVYGLSYSWQAIDKRARNIGLK